MLLHLYGKLKFKLENKYFFNFYGMGIVICLLALSTVCSDPMPSSDPQWKWTCSKAKEAPGGRPPPEIY